MRKRRRAGTEHVDPAHRNTIGQGNEDRHHDDVGGEEDADQPAGFGFREIPADDVARQQSRQGKGADLRQHLRQDDRTCVPRAAGLNSVHHAASPIRSSTVTQSRQCPSSFP
jgi:hypothetical protein